MFYFNKMAFIIFRKGQNAFSSRKVKIILPMFEGRKVP